MLTKQASCQLAKALRRQAKQKALFEALWALIGENPLCRWPGGTARFFRFDEGLPGGTRVGDTVTLRLPKGMK